MRKKRVWRYYCDYCKKAGCSAGHMAAHEKHCCGNPERACRMCWMDVSGDVAQQPMADLVAAFDREGLDGVRTLAQGCPACMLAAMIVWRKQQPQSVRDSEKAHPEFDFKKERNLWFSENPPREDYY